MCQLIDHSNYYRSYTISFYEKNPCTVYFIENENDYIEMFQTTIKLYC